MKNSSSKVFETRVATGEQPLVAECSFKIRIPEDTQVVRTLFAINMRGAGRHLFHDDEGWLAMARRTCSAMLYCEFEAGEIRDNGYGASMLKACDQFAEELDRPELKHAPFILWGHSMGGRVAQDFARYRPSRVLAFHIALRAFPSSAEFMREEPEAMKIPALYLVGEHDSTPPDMHAHFVQSRSHGAPRAWILLKGQGHWPRGMSFEEDKTTAEDWRTWSANDIVIPWTEAMIDLRLPDNADPRKAPVTLLDPVVEKGWLGNAETGQVARHPGFRGDKSQASWFPNEETARTWKDRQ